MQALSGDSLKALPAVGAEPPLLAGEILEGEGIEHDAFAGAAVRKGKEVPDLVGCLLDEAIEELLVVGRETVMVIFQPERGDDGIPRRKTGQSEEVLVSFPAEILGDDEEDEGVASRPPLVKVEGVEKGSCIRLLPIGPKAGQEQGVVAHAEVERQEGGNLPGERGLDTGWGTCIPKNKEFHSSLFMAMEGLKHIERRIASYIAENYRKTAEIGAGTNLTVARLLQERGISVFCTDIRPPPPDPGVPFLLDDIFSPDILQYRDCDLIYSLRPHEEMVPAMMRLARTVDCDLIVYHLGFESYGTGGELIDCGVILHRYHRSQNPSKRVR